MYIRASALHPSLHQNSKVVLSLSLLHSHTERLRPWQKHRHTECERSKQRERERERERKQEREREQVIECATERKQKRRESEWVSMRLGESEIEKGGGKGESAALKTDAAAFLRGCSVCLHGCFLECVCLREGWGCVNDASYTCLFLSSHSFPFLAFTFFIFPD